MEESGYLIGLTIEEEYEASDDNENSFIRDVYSQLKEYFVGKRKKFDIPIKFEGTEFQVKVWEQLCNIPYGETRSYGDIAKNIGNTKASRAVGGANNKNPIMIVVPCHRVIGANGKMVGFACGIEVKEYLLSLEAKYK